MDPEDNCILDVSKLSFEGNFDDQVKHILENVRLTRSEVINLKYLFKDLEEKLQHVWKGCEVQPFGSIVTGLGIRTSDVDCFVRLPFELAEGEDIHSVMVARNILRKYPMLFNNLFAITTAKIPILKFLHVPTNCFCDINFKSPAGVRNSKLIAFLLHMDKRVLPLAVLVKYWSKIHRFTGTNLMANYALTMLVIFYLQEKKILPSVLNLQKNIASDVIDQWNTSFNVNFHNSNNNNESLYDLMCGFFKYYTNFDFMENIVCPFLGFPISRKMFSNLDSVPNDFYYYKRNVNNEVYKPLRIDTKMCIQDPFEHCRNCAVAVYPKLFQRISSHFQFAAKTYDEKRNDEFLKLILTRDPQVSPDLPQHKPKHRFQNKVRKTFKGHVTHLQNNFRGQHGFNRVHRGQR